MPAIFFLVVWALLSRSCSCAPASSQPRDTQQLRTSLRDLEVRLVTYVNENFPNATQEEHDTILRKLANKMKHKILHALRRMEEDKGELLARMLKWWKEVKSAKKRSRSEEPNADPGPRGAWLHTEALYLFAWWKKQDSFYILLECKMNLYCLTLFNMIK